METFDRYKIELRKKEKKNKNLCYNYLIELIFII